MKLIKPSYEILTNIDGQQILKHIEQIARVCYKSENNITDESAKTFVNGLVKRGHTAMIEHSSISVKFICDRGVSHELVRHRLASFAQESTRYCDYSKDKFNGELTFIIPEWLDGHLNSGHYYKKPMTLPYTEHNAIYYEFDNGMEGYISADFPEDVEIFCQSLIDAESYYMLLKDCTWRAEQIRAILPNAIKTEIVVTANLREWRTIFQLRTAKAAHPQMRELMIPLLKEFKEKIPGIFDDIVVD